MNMTIMADVFERFEDKVSKGTCRVGIIGLGYVGIPLALRISEVGFPVTGFDISDRRVDTLNTGLSPLKHIPHCDINCLVTAGFRAETSFQKISDCDAIILCVPTPVDASRVPDLAFVRSALDQIAPHLRPGQLISLESTTWPGTTEEVIRPVIERQGLVVGQDVFVVYSPEREDPGNKSFTTRSIPKVIGGLTPACLNAGQDFYSRFIDHMVPVSSTSAAEMVKLLENIHRAVNIGLVNEIKMVADQMDLDIFEVIDAAATKPFGFRAYYPGPGIGGHCIPVDPFYLSWKARQFGASTKFIDHAGDVNDAMPRYVADRVAEGLNRSGKSVQGARVLVLGITYKPDIDDMRESPSMEVVKNLKARGAQITACDPCVDVDAISDLRFSDLTSEALRDHDIVVLLTDHTAFDYDMIRNDAPMLVDTRGRYRGESRTLIRA